jgi:hypothetical protein
MATVAADARGVALLEAASRGEAVAIGRRPGLLEDR